ncbi:Imm26 family immunity protein [Citrobacter enshiensis]|uniref:Imm26 family immunity protein n=1 Tax=Citrobacter enshiensis TaxID=2971264 RepID=UPI0023E78CB7|nr:Imm26 family immunity protein [Citrobacter enshiensis]WET42274.1 Imm26 family immunity protein [Citrobacter enshiensis]
MTTNKRRRKQSWDVGDMFTVPLSDGTYCIGKVVGFEPKALNSAICAFYAHRMDEIPSSEPVLNDNDLISILFVTRDLLDSGDWKVFSQYSDAFPIDKYLNLTDLQSNGFIGVKSIGSGLIIKLMNAYYSLTPWNAFYDPNYLDSLLISPDKKPKNVLLK